MKLINIAKKPRKAGLSPGTLSDVISQERSDVTVITYNPHHISEKQVTAPEELFFCKTTKDTSWINIEGTHDSALIQAIGNHFGLHSLLQEDIVCADQRPKLDNYGSHVFIVVKMLSYDNKRQTIKTEQVSFVLAENYVISFQETGKEGDVFGPNRERIRMSKGRMRNSGPDYLVYTLIDTIVDNYFLILEKIAERIEEMEEDIIESPSTNKLHELYRLKREMINLRKSVWPLREVISRMEREESKLIKDTTKVYLRDVYDHTISVIETVETYRDILSGLIDIYLSSLSNRMNNVMKVLTIISTIFMPLTFITGVYGMNFEKIPGLHSESGFYTVLGLCALLSVTMLGAFRIKRWL